MSWSDQRDVLHRTLQTTYGEGVSTYEPPAPASSFTIVGVFVSASLDVDPGGAVAIQSEDPVFGVRLVDIEAQLGRAPDVGDHVTHTPPGGTAARYRVKESDVDGRGWAFLKLHLAPLPNP